MPTLLRSPKKTTWPQIVFLPAPVKTDDGFLAASSGACGRSAEQNLGLQLYLMPTFFRAHKTLVPGAIEAIKASLQLVFDVGNFGDSTLRFIAIVSRNFASVFIYVSESVLNALDML